MRACKRACRSRESLTCRHSTWLSISSCRLALVRWLTCTSTCRWRCFNATNSLMTSSTAWRWLLPFFLAGFVTRRFIVMMPAKFPRRNSGCLNSA